MSTAENVLAALAAYRLKQESPGHYRCNSPFREGSDSHAFTLVIQDEEHGAYCDHVSNDAGSLYDLAQRLNIALPARAPVIDSKRQYTGLDDYAAAHGLPGDVLRAAGWSESKHDGRLTLEFGTKTGKRYRFCDGEKPYYKSVSGYRRCWYGMNQTLFDRLRAGQPLVICNGEISVVAGQYCGLAACAITGGEKSIPPDLIEDLKNTIKVSQAHVIIALDCDPTGQKAARDMEAQLKQVGFVSVRAVDLGLSKGGDLADFCQLHTPNVGAALEKCAPLPEPTPTTPAARRQRRIIPAIELQYLPPPTWLIDKEIPAQGLTLLYGPPGSGKSFLALDYALKVAQVNNVIYVAGEGLAGYWKRIAAWCKFFNGSCEKLHFSNSPVFILDSRDIGQFITQIAPLTPRLVVLDTLARCMVGGDENSTRDMGEFVDGCDQIQQAISSAVLIVHHVSKYGNLERGNSSLRAACDAIISITADDELITIESSKTKDESPFPTRYLKLLPVALDDGGESRVLIPAENVRQTANDPLSRQRRKVLSVLALADFDQGASATDIAKQTGIPEPSTRTAMSELFRLGYVSREMPANSKAYIYRLNDAGRAKLNEGDQNKSGDPQADQSPSSPSPSKVIGMIGPSDHKRQSPTKHTPQDSPDHIDHMDQDDHTDQLPIEDNTDYYRAGL